MSKFPKFHTNGVVELSPRDPSATVCGTCGRGWDDSLSTAWTPVPAGRCPFEYDHEIEEDDSETFYVMELDESNISDLTHPVELTKLIGIVSDHDGGIIAYAIGVDHANQLVSALNNDLRSK